MTLIVCIVLSLVWGASMFAIFAYADKLKFLPQPPRSTYNVSNINEATAMMSLYLVIEIVGVFAIMSIFRALGVHRMLSASWLLKYGTVFVCAYLLYFIDGMVRKHYYPTNKLLGWCLLSATIIALLFSLCSKPLLIMLSCAIGFVMLMFVATFKEFLNKESDEKVINFTEWSLCFGSAALLGVIGYIIIQLSEGTIDWNTTWMVCVFLAVAFWWLWVAMSYVANMQKHAKIGLLVTSRKPMLYSTELLLAFIILIVKYFVPSIKDVFENVSDMDIEV